MEALEAPYDCSQPDENNIYALSKVAPGTQCSHI